jgi:hypothetical protein
MNEVNERLDLSSLDPGGSDSGYWLRFHSRVLDLARDELARRQMVRDLGVVDVVFQWRKPLVPLALLAASLAGVFLYGHEESVTLLSPVALEEALVEDVIGDPIPTVLEQFAELDDGIYLASAGGF